MTEYVINNHETLDRALDAIRQEYQRHPYVKVRVKSGQKRSLDANALSWVWYQQIAQELGEDTPEEIHAECKLRLGVPILRAEDEDFRRIYDASIKNMPYDEKICAMQYIPVTSLMTRDQMAQYLDDMQKTYAKRGVVLEAE